MTSPRKTAKEKRLVCTEIFVNIEDRSYNSIGNSMVSALELVRVMVCGHGFKAMINGDFRYDIYAASVLGRNIKALDPSVFLEHSIKTPRDFELLCDLITAANAENRLFFTDLLPIMDALAETETENDEP